MLKTMCTNHLIPFHQEFAACIFQSLTPGFWIVWVQKNKGCILFAVPASMHQRQFSRQGFHPIYFEIPQESQNQRSSYNPLSDRKSTRLNSSHDQISYAVFCLKKKK